MIVTFISQCEKKALARTRLVLDAFANRIGDNTWQTVITQDGLAMVKKLLARTASKNTAVSCYRFHTRKHSELLWIVGNRHKFNEWGWVPVNWTNQEVFMDIEINVKDIYANSQGQVLSEHLFAVGYLAYHMIVNLNLNKPRLAQSALIAGMLHDIGKLDPQFQEWLTKKLNKDQENIALPEDGVHINQSDRGFGKFGFEHHPRHNELSWLMAASLLKEDGELNSAQCQQIAHAIYWHHTRPYRKNDKFFDQAKGIDKLFIKSLGSSGMDKLMAKLAAIFKDIHKIAERFNQDDFDLTKILPALSYHYELTRDDLPLYKAYEDIATEIDEIVADIAPNAQHNLVRMAVITADRIVSKMPSEDLQDYLKEGTLAYALDDALAKDSQLSRHIQACLDGFEHRYPNSERNQAQSAVAEELAELAMIATLEEADNVAVLQGPAGCGKTKIALEWAMKTQAQKIIWVCPRVQVCLGLFHDLTQKEYLPDSHIEIFTGEFKKISQGDIPLTALPDTEMEDYFSGDVIITTIDQILNGIISHQKITSMMDFMQYHVVFDEFHELIVIPAMNLLFAELIEAKKLRGAKANALLVSATPNDFFVKNVLKIDDSRVIRMDSFNQAKYQFVFDVYDETKQISPLVLNAVTNNKTTFVISNTAQDAQLGYLLHQDDENAILLHSKFTKQDKADLFASVLDSCGRQGNRRYQVLRSGPIVQASLNISCDEMFTDLTSPENWLQRLGRLNRFGEDKQCVYTTVMPQSLAAKKQSSSKAKFLANMCVFHSSTAWLGYLQNHLIDHGNVMGLNDLYQLYQAFYQDESILSAITEDIKKSLNQSVQMINRKLVDPISISSKKSTKTDRVAKIARVSLRGDNRFVQMAVCMVDNQLNPSFINEYAYDEETDHSQVHIGLTESTDRLQGGRFEMRDSEKDLLAFMHKKHHQILNGRSGDNTHKKSFADYELLKLARSPEYPIYTSYTPDDLAYIGGERERHKFAMYYVRTPKQAVGIMPINILASPKSVDNELANEAT
ncbi:CRISPR-associated helicase/endonuclease Cas3 [Moraxella canis]|uniref:CRISPR-associated protein Cas3 n=1 Tax=Moraxella canis TaxID=90239 RepID=A0A1S9ZLE6_9GAMM|nr:CRISPR-associated helicase/endonuclease Cas3 [Moraxella canis]OOR84284.1 CRISPR-associated protein Cas3 [Moraxella canis]